MGRGRNGEGSRQFGRPEILPILGYVRRGSRGGGRRDARAIWRGTSRGRARTRTSAFDCTRETGSAADHGPRVACAWRGAGRATGVPMTTWARRGTRTTGEKLYPAREIGSRIAPRGARCDRRDPPKTTGASHPRCLSRVGARRTAGGRVRRAPGPRPSRANRAPAEATARMLFVTFAENGTGRRATGRRTSRPARRAWPCTRGRRGRGR